MSVYSLLIAFSLISLHNAFNKLIINETTEVEAIDKRSAKQQIN